jgi:mRNA interferase MazF
MYGATNMTKGGILYKQRDIVFIPFPYNDLSGSKKRPAVILSGSKYNASNNDFVCCAITSNPNSFYRGVAVEKKDLDSGVLTYDSAVLPCKVFNPHRSKIVRKLGELSAHKSKEIVKFLNLNIVIEE